MSRRTRERLQLLVLGMVLAVCMLWPMWLAVQGAFRTHDDTGWTTWHVVEVFRDPVTRTGLVHAMVIASCVTAGTLMLSFGPAWVLSRFAFRGRSLLWGLLLLPMILPPFVGAIGLRHLLGREGAFNALLLDMGLIREAIDFTGRGGLWSVVLLETLSLYPIVLLNLTAALANLDPTLDEAGAGLGAGGWRRFRRITLPLIRPGAFAGAVIVFIWAFTELGTPLMFEYRSVTSVQIFEGLKEMETSRRPYALVAVMLTVAVLMYLLGRRAVGRGADAMQAKASMQRHERPLRGWRAGACWLGLGTVALVAALPHLATLLASLSPPGRWYGTVMPDAFTLEGWREAMTHPLAVRSIRNSLLLSVCATAAAVVVGLMAARLVVRGKIRGRGAIDAVVMLPLAVPGLVMAFGFVAMSLEWPFGGRMPGWLAGPAEALLPATWFAWVHQAPLRPLVDILGADPNPFPLLATAYAVRRLPYVARSAAAGLQQTSVTLEEAAIGLGASRWRVQRRIVLPLVGASVLAGGLLAFSFSMLEVSDSLLL
ncbi:MAG: iron ABC transporter permease, partial [Planctomycetes bacterium]|nr:iron ABC transporter permease [Planctomycetota bacterium]